jgi:hypothetical protein
MRQENGTIKRIWESVKKKVPALITVYLGSFSSSLKRISKWGL